MTAKKTILTPGTKAPISGQGIYRGPRGGKPYGDKEVTIVEDHIVPPTPKPGVKIEIVDPTKHKK
jgi:hypothetical protein